VGVFPGADAGGGCGVSVGDARLRDGRHHNSLFHFSVASQLHTQIRFCAFTQ
jgi:hypothetical protein